MRLNKNKEYLKDTKGTVEQVEKELEAGFELVNSIQNPIVTIFGSHITPKDDLNYEHCRETAHELGKRGYAIMSGGGPGIMQASNSGGKTAGVPSIGLQMALLSQEVVDEDNFTHQMGFNFFFVRRFFLHIKSEALIFYPGGYGTLNELFEFATLIDTGIVDPVPIILVNTSFWQGMVDWLKNQPVHGKYLSEKALNMLCIVDDFDDILKHMKPEGA